MVTVTVDGGEGGGGVGGGSKGPAEMAASASAGAASASTTTTTTRMASFDAARTLVLDDPPEVDDVRKPAWYLRTCFGTDAAVPGCFKEPAADVSDGDGALTTPHRVRVSFRLDAAAAEVPVGKPVRVAAERRWAVEGGFQAPAQAHGAVFASGKTMRTGLDARTVAARTAAKCFADVPLEFEDRGEGEGGPAEGEGERGDVVQRLALAGGVEVRVFGPGAGVDGGCAVEVGLRTGGGGGTDGGERCVRREFDADGGLREVRML